MSLAERAEAVRRLTQDEGLSDGQTAERLGITARSVLRIRQRHGIPAAIPRTPARIGADA